MGKDDWMKKRQGFRFGLFLVTIGIVYGDIGTSPMYVMKSILEGNGGIAHVNEDFIVGSLSLVFWTITLLTTIKYVLIAMKADNHGEGGIFSLYSLVKDYGKWLILPAMLGGAALLADGVLTPAVTVTTAVEGLRSIPSMDRFLGTGQWKVVIITLAIITLLFSVQHEGTSRIGKAFGPVMLIWFSFLGVTGALHILAMPVVLKAFNPLYAVRVLLSPYNKLGFMILGSVFLATTGAEALYSDMGHVGKENIYFSWPFVKLCLLLNYLGQGAWILQSRGDAALYAVEDLNPFFLMLPAFLRPFAVVLGAAAAIIASQALITGSYTLVSEAILLDLLPHLEIRYPSDTKGQLYIGAVNTVLWIGCSLVVLYFRSGARMESAYGLAITITMLMTTLLISVYLRRIRKKAALSLLVLVAFGLLEGVFFISSLGKFVHGGYVTVFLTFRKLFDTSDGTGLTMHPGVEKLFLSIGSCVFGIYLVEQIFREAFYDFGMVLVDHLPNFPATLLYCVVVLLGAYLLVLVLILNVNTLLAKFYVEDFGEYAETKSSGEGGNSDYLTWLDLSSPNLPRQVLLREVSCAEGVCAVRRTSPKGKKLLHEKVYTFRDISEKQWKLRYNGVIMDLSYSICV